MRTTLSVVLYGGCEWSSTLQNNQIVSMMLNE
jgi:hypothetical protein